MGRLLEHCLQGSLSNLVVYSSHVFSCLTISILILSLGVLLTASDMVLLLLGENTYMHKGWTFTLSFLFFSSFHLANRFLNEYTANS